MSDGIESVDVVGPWLYAKLNGDPVLRAAVGGRISDTLSPGALTTPYLTYALASNRDRVTADGVRMWTVCIYDVKVVAQTASWTGPIITAARRVNALLHGVDEDTPNGRVECRRERFIQEAELSQAIQHRHLGGRFRVLAYSL